MKPQTDTQRGRKPPFRHADLTADRFRAWLAAHNWGQTEFARRCGIDPRRVRSWVNGENGLNPLLPVVLELLELENNREKPRQDRP